MSDKSATIKAQIMARRAGLVATALGSAVAVNCSAKSLDSNEKPCLSVDPVCDYGVDEQYCDPCDRSCRVCLSPDPSGGAGGLGGEGPGGANAGGANDGGAEGVIR